MLLVEQVFEELCEHDLVQTAEDFSTDWCCKSRSWFSERKHSQRDFSVSAAISCLDAINTKQAILRMRQRRMGGLLDAEVRALERIRQALRLYLQDQYRIGEVVPPTTNTSEHTERPPVWLTSGNVGKRR